LFRRRIAGVVVEDGLGEHAHKKLFSHKKKISLPDGNKGYISIRLPRKCKFFLCFLFIEIVQNAWKRAYANRKTICVMFFIFRDHIECGEKRICRLKRVATQKQKIENRNIISTKI
jgi:hypothetical protein